MPPTAVAACLVVAACSRERSGGDVDLNAAAQQAQGDIDHYAALRQARAARSRPPAMTSGAAMVVSRYYSLIGEHRYAAAWALWGDHGTACGRSPLSFAASFDGLAGMTATVGREQDADAGAGHLYVKVPVSLHLLPRRGTPVEARVMVTLHRVADGIDSDDPDDHRWRIVATTTVPPVKGPVPRPCAPTG